MRLGTFCLLVLLCLSTARAQLVKVFTYDGGHNQQDSLAGGMVDGNGLFTVASAVGTLSKIDIWRFTSSGVQVFRLHLDSGLTSAVYMDEDSNGNTWCGWSDGGPTTRLLKLSPSGQIILTKRAGSGYCLGLKCDATGNVHVATNDRTKDSSPFDLLTVSGAGAILRDRATLNVTAQVTFDTIGDCLAVLSDTEPGTGGAPSAACFFDNQGSPVYSFDMDEFFYPPSAFVPSSLAQYSFSAYFDRASDILQVQARQAITGRVLWSQFFPDADSRADYGSIQLQPGPNGDVFLLYKDTSTLNHLVRILGNGQKYFTRLVSFDGNWCPDGSSGVWYTNTNHHMRSVDAVHLGPNGSVESSFVGPLLANQTVLGVPLVGTSPAGAMPGGTGLLLYSVGSSNSTVSPPPSDPVNILVNIFSK